MRGMRWLVLAACVAVVGPVVWAQGGQRGAASPAPTRGWWAVNIVTIKPGSGAAWTEFQKTQTIPMQQKGGVRQRDTWQSGAPFGDGNTYAIVTPIEKFEEYDKPALPTRVLSGDALGAFREKSASFVVSSRTFAIQDRTELSVVPASMEKIRGAILTDVTIVGGHAAQYEAFLKNDLLPVLKKGNVPGYLVSRTVFGGNAAEYHELQLFESYGEIDKGPISTRVLGAADAQALGAKRGPHVASANRTIMRYVPALSYAPRPKS